jgi:anaerobic magnesium-protoporphyrin IX monomethyl ester cyclase
LRKNCVNGYKHAIPKSILLAHNVAGIRVTFNLIFGYPGETQSDREETFRTMSEVACEFPNVSFSPNVFTPYPGIPIWPQLRELGVHEPQSLKEWAELPQPGMLRP